MPKPIKELNKETLEHLYITEKMSMREIAELLNASQPTVLKYIHLYGIKVRTKSEIFGTTGITKEDLIELYVNQKKSLGEVAEIYKVSRPTISEYLKAFGIDRRPKGCNNFNNFNKSIKAKPKDKAEPKRKNISKKDHKKSTEYDFYMTVDDAAEAILGVIGW